MLAAVYRTHGTSDVLRIEEVRDPEPAPGEVRVRLRVSGVNPTDWKSRSRPDELPWPWKTPNQDGAGEIDRVGDGVDLSRLGERVWVYHAAHGQQGGTAAQYVCVPSRQAVHLPASASLEQGAGLGIPYLTAAECLRAAGPIEGGDVLVTGGAGAVGNATIQLARLAGARVVATASTQDKARLARAAGADVVLDYRVGDVADRLTAEAPAGLRCAVDVALEHNLDSYVGALAPGAVISSYSSSPAPTLTWPLRELRQHNATIFFVLVYGVAEEWLQAGVDLVGAALARGELTPLPVHRFPLTAIAEAHDAQQQGAVGKVLVDIP